MNMESLFQKYKIRDVHVNLKRENFDKYTKYKYTKAKTENSSRKSDGRIRISTDECRIILSSVETDEILQKLNESEHSIRCMHRYLILS